ncbi:hypothetical protein AVE30378_02142 [Achromobacter veterisilvae]|uniref:Phage tail lysozyme domain-containing protein n=1 Tax=Achromobacter veterisilvae TaxID=2069367 RepID=A0A446CFM2_9BURK|nr:phage tail tip lysozyme [Achromobacter veterisilvae]SSW66603.1 hypothetical protein AVE30378_02142 [Achromobacter veterisilvae]
MSNELSFRISAIDNASKVADKVRGSFGRISDPVGRMSQRFSEVGKRGAAALGKVSTGLDSISKGARTVADRIASIVPGMAALTGLAGAAGVGALAQRWASLGANVQRTSRQLGVSAQGLRAWHYAAQRAGVAAEQFDQSMISSQNTIREAAFGANPQAMMLLSRLGVQISRTKDGQIDYQRTQHDVLTALGKIKNPAGQRTAADALGVGALLPMIQRGTFDADRQRAVLNGYAPGEEAIRRAAEFNDRINELTSGAGALASTIGDKLVPVLTPMVEKFSSWLTENRVNIADRLADAVGKLTGWITSVDWGAWYERVNAIADVFGGWGNVLTAIVGIKFASTLLEWTGALAGLASTLTAAKTAAEGLKTVAGGAGAAGAASAAPWWARVLNPWAVGAGALLYSSNLNGGEEEMLRQARQADGKRYLTPQESAPGGASDPKIVGIARRLTELGWGQEQAAGIAANILRESGGNPYSVGDGGRAYGIGQWHPDRQKDFERVFKKDIRSSTLDEQIRFFDWELRNGPGQQRYAGDLLQKTGSAGAAAAIVSQYHERPQDVEGEKAKRAAMADQVLRAMGGSPVASSGGADAAPALSGPGMDQISRALESSFQRLALNINVSAPPGTRVEAQDANSAALPTRVNYSMGLGAMP